jgi:WD40 repeat protein
MASALSVTQRGALAANATEEALAGGNAMGTAIKSVAMKEFTEARKVAVAEQRAAARLLDPTTVLKHKFTTKMRDGHTVGVYYTAFSDDGALLASCGQDGRVLVWDTGSLDVKRSYVGHTGPVFSVSFWPLGNNDRLLSCGMDGTVKLWQKKTGRLVFTGTDHKAPVYAACFNWAGTLIASAGESMTVIVYELSRIDSGGGATGSSVDKMLFRIEPYGPKTLQGHSAPIRSCAFEPKDKFLLTGGDDRAIRVWDASGFGSFVRKLEGHTAGVQGLNFAPKGSLVVSASADATARIWNWKTGACVRVLRGHTGTVYSAVFSPEGGGRRVLTGGHDRNVVVWEAATGAMLQRMEAHRSFVLGCAFSLDGLVFATASGDATIGLWAAVAPTCLDRLLRCFSGSGGDAKSTA